MPQKKEEVTQRVKLLDFLNRFLLFLDPLELNKEKKKRKTCSKHLLTVNYPALATQISMKVDLTHIIPCYKRTIFILLDLIFLTGLQLGMNIEVMLGSHP